MNGKKVTVEVCCFTCKSFVLGSAVNRPYCRLTRENVSENHLCQKWRVSKDVVDTLFMNLQRDRKKEEV